MSTYKKQLAIVQSAKETTKGTIVAATGKVAFSEFKLTPIDEVHRPDLVLGVMLANRGNEFVIKRGVEWEINGDVVLAQFHQWLGMAVQPPTKSGASDPYTWTATRNATADPGLSSRSIEYRLTDGTTPSDWKFGYAMAKSLEVSGAEGQPLTFSLKGFGRRLQTATLTAGQAMPAIEIPHFAQSVLYIDGSWTTPSTLIAAQLLGWKYTIETGVMPVYTADALSDLDYKLDEINTDDVKVSAEILLLATASGQWTTEKTAAEAGTLRQITLKATQATTPERSIQFRALMKYEAGSIFPDGEKDGLQTINLKLVGSTDGTNFMEMVVKNGVQTLT